MLTLHPCSPSQYAAMSLPSKMQAAAQAAAKRLVALAQAQGSTDDVAVVVNVYDWGNGPVVPTMGSGASISSLSSMSTSGTSLSGSMD